ncbi:MAG: MFS transporter [Alphaproteobacteria bacterium]|nr:MFS transporter [Alphaproteobacteria bacterium]
MRSTSTLADRRGLWAFVLGVAAVTVGVFLHLPMFLMGKAMHYRLAGMAMEPEMVFGMAAIVGGLLVAAWGLLPRNIAAQRAAAADIVVAAPEDARLGPAHWSLMVVLVLALVIDVMKPASLGFAVPEVGREYGVPKATASLLSFVALTGTVCGSVLWGFLADIYGRKATILLSAVFFIGTAICGAMPSLAWNVFMCFMMGIAAGGMLPVTYALLAEMMPTRHRGWSLVLVGGLGAAGGYFAASGASAVLQPIFTWRILFLLNLPTGLLLVLLGVFIPESVKFLRARGRADEARAVMARFGAEVREAPAAGRGAGPDHLPLQGLHLVGKLTALSIAAVSWGLINFGLMLWLPGDLQEKGYSIAVSSKLLAESALIALPTVFLCAFLYSRWSTKWSLVTMLALTLAGLLLVLRLELAHDGSPVVPVALLIVGSNGVLAVLLPYTAESFPLRVRGRATGWVAACTKGGGVAAQAVSIAGLVPPMALVAAFILVPVLVGTALISWFGRETRGGDLRHLDAEDAVTALA